MAGRRLPALRFGLPLVAVLIAGSCMPSADISAPLDGSGVTLADHTGGTLVIASVAPAELGDNLVRVFLRDPGGKPLGGSAHASLRRGAREVAVSDVAAGAIGSLTVDTADDYELAIEVKPDGQPAGTVRFLLTLPARVPESDLLARIDRAMNELQGLRESQTLTSGLFLYVFDYDYQAPDRIRFSFVGPEGIRHETIIVGSRRFDLEGRGVWTESDLGTAVTTATFSLAAASKHASRLGDCRRPRGADRRSGFWLAAPRALLPAVDRRGGFSRTALHDDGGGPLHGRQLPRLRCAD